MKFLATLLPPRPWLALVTLVTGVAVLAFIGVSLGLAPIRASSRHWAVTEWFLHYAMTRAVWMQSWLAPAAPSDLDRDANVLKGARHYDFGCRPCHGSPGEPMPAIPHAMTPHPPALQSRIEHWQPRELFHLVKHGVKFTGMPAWPAQQRDDEVWAMVAFLRILPSLDRESYLRIARGGGSSLEALTGPAAPAPPDIVTANCARCHGLDGRGRESAFPALAGQRLEYMTRAMRAYAEGRRHSGVMQPVAKGLAPVSRDAALEYYGGLPRPRPAPPDTDAARRGERLAWEGVPDEGVPACAMCHLVSPVNDAFPRLAGQDPDYLAGQLRLMQARRRGGSAYLPLMHAFVDRLTRAQIDEVTSYLAFAAEDLVEHAGAGNVSRAEAAETGDAGRGRQGESVPAVSTSPRW
jgi:cytochrome c553